jgi:phosphatidylserine/phosphatidylglycerophosphate/cardiolipin synthase-like enzyme
VQVPGKPAAHFCFSPHTDTDLSLNPLGAAIDQATSSVFFSIAFLYQNTSGPTRESIDRLMNKDVFSYGISDKLGGLTVKKPDGSFGLVDFNYLAAITPMPFKAEWSGGKGIHEHHKFVVTDFSLPTAKVFTGSSNLSPSGEQKNGDNLVMIEDPRVATSYAIEALRVFDHLHFRSVMSDAFARRKPAQCKSAKSKSVVKKSSKKAKKGKPAKKSAAPSPQTAALPGKAAAMAELTLQKPTVISGQPAWFADYYATGSQKERDRKLFSH